MTTKNEVIQMVTALGIPEDKMFVDPLLLFQHMLITNVSDEQAAALEERFGPSNYTLKFVKTNDSRDAILSPLSAQELYKAALMSALSSMLGAPSQGALMAGEISPEVVNYECHVCSGKAPPASDLSMTSEEFYKEIGFAELEQLDECDFIHIALTDASWSQYDQVRHWIKDTGKDMAAMLSEDVNPAEKDATLCIVVAPDMTEDELLDRLIDCSNNIVVH